MAGGLARFFLLADSKEAIAAVRRTGMSETQVSMLTRGPWTSLYLSPGKGYVVC